MKKIALIITIAAIFSGCRSSANETPNANVSPNAVIPANTNSNLVSYNTGVDSNAFNGNSANTVVVTNKQPANQKSDYGTPRPAPDDSEFNTTMNSKGEFLETRTFKSHPQLLKIERKTSGTVKALKVYLKNGKVYDLSEEKVPNFMVAAPQNVLIAIGVARQPEPKPATKDKTKEESENEN